MIMKKLAYKIVAFFMYPFFIILFVELLSPVSTFTFRGYESIIFSSKVPHLGHFYPNCNFNIKAEGDLCHHTKFAVMKNEKWVTDKIGYRNNSFIEKADIVLLGNSFIYGTGLTQKDIISNQIIAKFKNKLKVYNMAPATMGEFDFYLRNNIIKKPKYIILGIGEMSVAGGYISIAKNEDSFMKKLTKKIFYSGLNAEVDKSFRFYSLKWLKARMKQIQNLGIKGEMNKKMFFGQGKNPKKLNESELQESVKEIVSCKKYCDSLNIKFIFIPTPNKETVYFDFVKLEKQPDYLTRLIVELNKHNVKNINTIELFNEYRKDHNELLYHLDDTHWNALGISVVVNKLTNLVTIQ